AIVLHHVQRNLERLDTRARGRKTRRQSRDLTRDRQIAFQVRRRNRERVGEVVEAAVGGLVAGQERLDVNASKVEREQIADGVAVFGAVETMDGADASGIRARGPRAIDFGFEPARDRMIGRRVRPWPSGRRHRAGAKLRDHTLPQLRVVAGPGDVDTIERNPTGAKPLVVTRDAILIEYRSRRRRSVSSL